MDFTVKTLPTDEAARAFPLIQAHDHRCTLDQWQHFVRTLADPGALIPGSVAGGTIIVTDLKDYIHGLFTYRVIPHLTSGRSLQVEHFVPFEGLTTKGVAKILLAEVDPLARRLGCRCISIDVPARAHPVAEPTHPAVHLLDATGHRIDTARLVRTL